MTAPAHNPATRPIPPALCRKTSRHQVQQLHADVRRFGRAVAAELNRWIAVKAELLVPLVVECSECGGDL